MHGCLPLQVGFFHCYLEGVDYVFVDHPCYHAWARECRAGPPPGAACCAALRWHAVAEAHMLGGRDNVVHCRFQTADEIYGGSRMDVIYRCALLSKAALEVRAVHAGTCRVHGCDLMGLSWCGVELPGCCRQRMARVHPACPTLTHPLPPHSPAQVPYVVPCGGVTYGDNNLLFIANDWHTALVPVYLQAHYRRAACSALR